MFDEKWFHCIHAGRVFNPFVAGVRLRNSTWKLRDLMLLSA